MTDTTVAKPPSEGDLVELHCICGQSFVGPVHHDAREKFTRAWYQVHCGEGHGHSKVPVTVVDVEELLAQAFHGAAS